MSSYTSRLATIVQASDSIVKRKAKAKVELKDALKKLLAISKCTPEDEEWFEEQERWGKEWDSGVVSPGAPTSFVSLTVTLALQDNLLAAVETANKFGLPFQLDAKTEQEIQVAEEARSRWREVCVTTKNATPTIGSIIENPPHSNAKLLSRRKVCFPMCRVNSLIIRLQRCRAELHDEDKEEPSLKKGEVVHDVPCEGCAQNSISCIGNLSGSCRRCAQKKKSCDKASGRGRRRVKAAAGKEKAPGKSWIISDALDSDVSG